MIERTISMCMTKVMFMSLDPSLDGSHTHTVALMTKI